MYNKAIKYNVYRIKSEIFSSVLIKINKYISVTAVLKTKATRLYILIQAQAKTCYTNAIEYNTRTKQQIYVKQRRLNCDIFHLFTFAHVNGEETKIQSIQGASLEVFQLHGI